MFTTTTDRSVPGKKRAAQPFPVGRIVSARPPRKRHYGKIIDETPDPPDYEAATERMRQIIERKLKGD